MSLQVKVLTAEKVVWDTTSTRVVLPAVSGDIGILPGHASLVTVLEAGVVRKKNEGAGWTPVVLFGGFAEVKENQVIVLGTGAEEITAELTKQKAEEMAQAAIETFETIKLNSTDKEEIDAAALEVKIAKARITAVGLL